MLGGDVNQLIMGETTRSNFNGRKSDLERFIVNLNSLIVGVSEWQNHILSFQATFIEFDGSKMIIVYYYYMNIHGCMHYTNLIYTSQ